MVDEKFIRMLGNLREACKQSGLVLPESIYDASTELSTALSASGGDEEGALKLLTAKFKRGAKREHSAIAGTADAERNTEIQRPSADGDVEEGASVELEDDEVGVENAALEEEEEDEEPPRKLSRLAEDICKKPAVVASNQVIVDAFADYGDQHLHRRHTGKGVTHLRAARAIRDYPYAITSGAEARDVPMVGVKMATEVEQILNSGKLETNAPWSNVSTPDAKKHTPPRLVREVHTAKAKCPENQAVVDELAKFGEHELYFRNGTKGTAHLRAARALQLTDHVIISGCQARRLVAFVGPAIADKIDQIIKYGRIVKDTPVSGEGARTAPIVNDVRGNSAVRPENQSIVDALVDYGDSQLNSDDWGKGIAHLRAANAIRDADVVVTSSKQAAESIELVEANVIAQIDELLKHGHADTDGDNDDGDGKTEEGSDCGARESPDSPPIVHEVHRKPAQIEGNLDIVDALSVHEEMQLAKWHSGQGTAFMRVARHLRELVTSSSVAKALGCIGEKVVTFVDMMGFKSTDDAATDATEESGK